MVHLASAKLARTDLSPITIPSLPADTDLNLEPNADGELDTPTRSSAQSIEVGFWLLEILTYTTGPMMPRDLARAAPMNPAKAHRYLMSFACLGFITQTPEGRCDSGPLALEVGLMNLNRQDSMHCIRPAATALRGEIDYIVGLAIWGNQSSTIVYWGEASHPATVGLHLGDVVPVLNSAIGRTLGAYLLRTQARLSIQCELDRITTRGESVDFENPELPQTFEAYDAICADVRLRGASRIHGGVLPGINAMSLLAFDTNGQLCLALIVLGAQSTSDITWSSPLE